MKVQRGKDLFLDSFGYTYTFKNFRGKTTNWWCSVRNRNHACPAAVRHRDDVYIRSEKEHSHPPDPTSNLRIKITTEAKKTASTQSFRSALTIVEDVALTHNVESAPGVPNMDLIVRRTNRHRQSSRPADPTDMSFELAEDHIPPGFFRKEVSVKDNQHFIFCTDFQLDVLKKAERWYFDGTFKVVRSPPFAQLFTIHAFVRRGDTAKQIPLVYVVMSGKSKKDYIAVLVAIQEMLDDEWVVQDFVVDYEAAMWEALRAVFLDADIHGCVFHWAQAVWRKVQALGLATSYMERQSTHAFIGKLLSLPFLPEEHTLPTFQFLADLTDDHQLQPLLSYIYRTWFRSTAGTDVSTTRPTGSRHSIFAWNSSTKNRR